ncbi:hypothetical protein GUITHDRAFT_98948 [Guillardia theta CCMP2712]|uniref:Uncharacterized protein n=1 Tax=Guillardia theta (strain CCMP2712) TaxID=905079 RepID=L1K3K7_GUITC|nr:hypothetical protein GUITHDRAFT_98948 [Guillardia theta CCMP2712]EKX55167.1 hypothetical protein GUITHDRAFT_98948 [Guillardia theta CCMP2712]|eukprot:XP_005842147.1 hypothetical protein GUITHDRAFT_98948 [Guillardia theta CCMP2712]
MRGRAGSVNMTAMRERAEEASKRETSLASQLDHYLGLRKDGYGTNTEGFFHIIFLIVFTAVVMDQAVPNEEFHSFCDSLSTLFVIDSIPENDARNATLRWFNQSIATKILPPDAQAVGYFGGGSLLLVSHIQVRQLRVVATPCNSLVQTMTTSSLPCYGGYTQSNEFRSPLTLRAPGSNSSIASYWELGDGTWTRGKSGTAYPSSGNMLYLPLNRTDAMAMLRLMSSGWMAPGTRAMLVDYLVICPSLRLLGTVRQIVEFLPSGKVETDVRVEGARMEHVLPTGDKLQSAGVAGEIVVLTWICLLTVRELYILFRIRWWYVLGKGRLWRLWSWTVFALGAASMAYRLQPIQLMNSQKYVFPPTTNRYFPSFQSVLLLLQTWRTLLGVNLALCWLRSLQFMHNISVLRPTLEAMERAMLAVISIVLVCFIPFLALAMVHQLVLGSIRSLLMKKSETWKGAWKKLDEEILDEKLKVEMVERKRIDKIESSIAFLVVNLRALARNLLKEERSNKLLQEQSLLLLGMKQGSSYQSLREMSSLKRSQGAREPGSRGARRRGKEGSSEGH